MAQNIIGGPDIVFFVCFVFFFLTLSPGCCRWRSIPQSPSCYSLNQPNIRVKLTSSGGVNWKSEKSGRGGKKGGRERKKHVTLITSMPAGPHSPCFFFPPSSFSVIRPCRRTCTSATGRSVEVTRTQKLREWFHWGEKKKSCVVVIGGGDRRERWRACRSSNCVFFGLFSKCLGALSLRLHLSLSNTLDGTGGSDQRLDDDTHTHTRANTPLLLSLSLPFDSQV